MRQATIILALQFLIFFNLYPQAEPDYREMFLEAESNFLFEEYNEARPLYLRLITALPDNDNYNYKIGVCYLNDPYEKEKAIDYLEKAIQNINPEYKDNNFKETGAPLDALFYLGNAYRINDQIDKAIETYQKFKEQADPDVYDHELVDEQITACQNALDLKNRPIDLNMRNLGDRINTRFSDVNPVVSGDETKMVYIQKQQFYDAVFFSEIIDGQWSYPRLIIPELGVDEDAYPTGLSYDGSELLIYRSDNFIGDIYSSRLVDGFWTKLTKLNDNINTKYWESHACFSRTGDTLYFTSNRKGTYGGLDIYISVKDNLGEWGRPVNLGPTINSKYNEETPFITQDGKTLYFSSYGHYNMGGYDVFYSTLMEDNTWSTPINAGVPINTTDDDIFFQPIQSGIYGYFPRFFDEGFGRSDIYKIEIFTTSHPRKFRIRGLVSLPAETFLTKPITVKLIQRSSRDTVAVTQADLQTGEFYMDAPSGQYDLLIQGDEIQTTSSSLIILYDHMNREIDLTKEILVTLTAKLKEIPSPQILDKISTSDTLIMVSSDEPVDIRLNLERDADLFINIYNDTIFVGTDTFRIERRRFTYSFIPLPGKNILKLKLVDKDGNLSFKDVIVVYTPPPTAPVVQPVKADTVTQPLTGVPDEELEQFLKEYIEIADEDLKTFLEELDLKKEGITSEKELIEYMKKKSEILGFSSQDVYDLILQHIQYKYIQSYIDQLTYLSEDENMKTFLQQLNPAAENITSLQDLYEFMINNAGENTFQTGDVNELFSILSQRAELLELINQLSDISSGNLKNVFEELDPDREKLLNSVDLIIWLLENSEEYEYTETEVMTLLVNYLEEEDLQEIMKVLIATSSGTLEDFLISLNLRTSNISNIGDLYEYLLYQSKFNDFTESDVINLFLNLLNVIDNQELIKKVEPPPPPAEKERKGSGLVYWLIGAGLLIIFLIILWRRKKDKDQEENLSSAE
ncbi:MAG: hypothetical protein AMS27_11720 [Bacteroides sp. SM23_62_1]|nr:MAG: hypothetical protein AMS27_11720 [Bacteroides sp. SM23_62_1]